MFNREDYTREDSKDYKKAVFTFEIFKEKNWTVECFRNIIDKFQWHHKYQNWLPSSFIEIWENSDYFEDTRIHI